MKCKIIKINGYIIEMNSQMQYRCTYVTVVKDRLYTKNRKMS